MLELTTDKIRQILISEDYAEGLDFLADESDYRDEVENGIPIRVCKFGITEIDKHIPWKNGQLVNVVGHTNVGKTSTILWLRVQLAKTSGLKFVCYLAENRISAVVRLIIKFYFGKDFDLLSQEQKEQGFEWVKDHFKFIKHIRMYTYKQVLNMATVALDAGFEFDEMIIDPYNSLRLDLKGLGKHDYNIQANEEMRVFCEMTKKSIIMNCHTTTDAQRQKDNDGNTPRPLFTDVEGGAPFVNKADDVMVIHRHVRDPHRFMITEIYVDKIREQEYGGEITPWKSPIELRFRKDRSGYDVEGSFEEKVNSREGAKIKQLEMSIENNAEVALSDDLPF